MLYEILVRATDLLQEISPITGSSLTIGEDIPETQQDFEGYVAWWGDATWTQERVNDTQNRISLTLPGFLQSPQIGLGNRFTTRTFVMQYADAIKTKFIRRPRLMNSTGQALNGVETSTLINGNIRPAAYPDGNNQLVRLRYSFALFVTFLETNPC